MSAALAFRELLLLAACVAIGAAIALVASCGCGCDPVPKQRTDGIWEVTSTVDDLVVDDVPEVDTVAYDQIERTVTIEYVSPQDSERYVATFFVLGDWFQEGVGE